MVYENFTLDLDGRMSEIILVLRTLVNIIIKSPILLLYNIVGLLFLIVHNIGCENHSDHMKIETKFDKFGDKIWNYGFK